MRLIELIGEAAYQAETDAGRIPAGLDGGPEISVLTADSRAAGPGALFAALPGTVHDGRAFISQAVAAGAAAVLAPPDIGRDALGPDTALISDAEPRRRFAHMAAAFYGVQPRVVAAVTGTNGKTSIADFLRQIWRILGIESASLGTLGLVTADGEIPPGSHLTTADPVSLHRDLAGLAGKGIDHLALEASSHGLAQHRLDGVRLRAGAFTNLTRDHLDYHETMEDYRVAKLRLFDELLPEDATAVVRANAVELGAISGIARQRGLRLFTYGVEEGDIHCREAEIDGPGWNLEVDMMGETARTRFPLPGRFQLENALCALGLAIACGADPVAAAAALAEMKPVPGRMEIAGRLDNGAAIVIDYAHSPDALETVLTALRPFAGGQLSVVFGCGGDRDRGKRAPMGEIAARLADRPIVTNDNPRGEDAAAIRRDVMAGCPVAREVGDRAGAIRIAMSELGPEDMLLVAGKGHETGQVVGNETLPFSDFETIQTVLREMHEGTA